MGRTLFEVNFRLSLVCNIHICVSVIFINAYQMFDKIPLRLSDITVRHENLVSFVYLVV